MIIFRIHYLQPVMIHGFGAPFHISGPFIFLVGPLCYLYLRSIVRGDRGFRRVDLAHFLPALVHLLLFLPAFIIGWESDYAFYLIRFIGSPWIFIIIQLAYYLYHTRRLAAEYRQLLIGTVSNVEGREVAWVERMSWVLVVILVFVTIVSPGLVHGPGLRAYFHASDMFFSLALFYIASRGLLQRRGPTPEGLPSEHSLAEKDLGDLKATLLTYMKEQKPFLDPELTLAGLAQQVDMGRNQLSEVINSGVGDNFYHFVNQYRVDEVKRLIDDDTQRKYTILALAREAGFHSKSSFNQIFKKFTGLTPSEYRNGHS